MRQVLVYDALTRVFHWLFAGFFVTAFAISNLVDDESARFAWRLRRRLDAQGRDFSAFRQQAEAWRTGSKKYLDGLSQSISLQLDQWQLSAAEKEVAFLLLKGLSLKEIAAARRTTEKTA